LAGRVEGRFLPTSGSMSRTSSCSRMNQRRSRRREGWPLSQRCRCAWPLLPGRGREEAVGTELGGGVADLRIS